MQCAADAVVVHDVKLEQHVVARLRDRLENCSERRLAVDQQARVVAAEERHQRQALERGERLRPVRTRFALQHRLELAFDASRERANVGVPRTACEAVAAKLASAEHRIERQRHPGKDHQRDRPGHRALRRPCGHHRAQRRDDAGNFDDDERPPRTA